MRCAFGLHVFHPKRISNPCMISWKLNHTLLLHVIFVVIPGIPVLFAVAAAVPDALMESPTLVLVEYKLNGITLNASNPSSANTQI